VSEFGSPPFVGSFVGSFVRSLVAVSQCTLTVHSFTVHCSLFVHCSFVVTHFGDDGTAADGLMV